VARRRVLPDAPRSAPKSRELIFAFGGTAQLDDSSIVLEADTLVAIDVEERADGRGGLPRVRLASAFEPEWLIDLFTDALTETSEVRWNGAQERVEQVDRLAYGNLTLDESRATPDPEKASALLLERAKAAGFEKSGPDEALSRWLERVAFVARAAPEVGAQVPDGATLEAGLRVLCEGRSSFAELREASMLEAMKRRFTQEQLRRIDALAPERLTLPGGRSAPVEYPADQPPFIASRLQDFFGMARGPTVAGGRVPVVIHLLAPNKRAVQVTQDLAGFWARHYPALRKELGRKYPRHAWPEDPLNAPPPHRPR